MNFKMKLEKGKSFTKVFDEEMKGWIQERRIDNEVPINKQGEEKQKAKAKEYSPKVENELVGLAISGGGIRSATYALGVLQRVAKARVLTFVDYLATASGGGYLGACWSSLTANKCKKDDDKTFGSDAKKFPFKFNDKSESGIFDRESAAVRHLRAHGYWLAPHIGVFNVWTWVMLLRFLLSLFINLLAIPIPWIVVIMIPLLQIPDTVWNRMSPWNDPGTFIMWIGPVAFLAIFSLFIWMNPSKQVGPEVKHGVISIVQKVLLLITIVWILLVIFVFGIAGYYDWAKPWIASTGGSFAALVVVGKTIYNYFTEKKEGGVTLNFSEGTGKMVLGIALGIIGYVAMAILLIVLFIFLQDLFYSMDKETGIRAIIDGRSGIMWGIWGGALGIALIMLFIPVGWFLNFFSLQLLYRRGLSKAYMLKKKGDSNEVEPRKADYKLVDIRRDHELVPDMPYHLIVTAVNTSGEKDLENLGRRSDSFVFANLYSGSKLTGYFRTKDSYNKMPLSEAMAISGAAVAPNMGRTTRTSFSILLTLMNIRLGSWVKNPGYPSNGIVFRSPIICYWIKELFGVASTSDRLIYLSDGGHFDNSAIYELLKRRCKYILAIDAGNEFDNLATVSRLARVDLGIQIEANLDLFKPDPETGLSPQPYVVARIKYPSLPDDTDPNEGILVWLSTGMTENQKPDVQKYKEKDPDFPFNTTGDQFFDQEQFEAYRELGHTAAKRLLDDAGIELDGGNLTREELGKRFNYLLELADSWSVRRHF